MNKNKMIIRRIAILSVMLAAAIVLNIVDSFIVLPLGFRLGLANIIGVLALYIYGFKEAFLITLLRVLLASLLRGTFGSLTFFMSLSGALLAIIMMWIFKKFMPFGKVVVSVLGAISHSVGQLLMSVILSATGFGGMTWAVIGATFPWLLLMSVPTGILTGIIADRVYKIYEKNVSFKT